MKQTTKLGVVAMLIIAFMMFPAMAGNDNGNYPNGNDNQNNNNQPLDIDVNNNLDVNVDVDNSFDPEIDVNNVNKNYNYNDNLNVNLNLNENNNKNYNTNNNVNNNYVDQSQRQNQNQIQLQVQDQSQKQSQSQNNVQTVTIPIPTGADGGMLISTSNQAQKVSQLDVGEATDHSRLVYPGEVIAFKVSGGDYIYMHSSSDIAMYTIGTFTGDALKINSVESTPTYNPISHKFEWGIVVPIDVVDYWTTKANIVASENAQYVVIDNRAPRNSYTHVEIGIQKMNTTFQRVPEPTPVVGKPDVYPTDEYGRAITG